MHPLEKETEKIIRRRHLLRNGETVVVGVSAGPDSMALLNVLARLRPRLGLALVAVYVDHGLRPEETPAERDLVRGQAARLGVGFEARQGEARAEAARLGLSLEHAARELRYGFLDEIAARYGAGRIAVAHTADDQAEELMLRLIRGTGRKGLAGMAQLSAGRIVRPFLTQPKEKLLAYLVDRKIPYLEDSSNRERVFLRNRIRLDLIPYLAEHFNPAIARTLRRTAAILEDEDELLADLAAVACGEALVVDGEEEGGAGKPAVRLLLKPLLAQPRAIQRRVIEAVFWRLGNPPTFRKIEQVLGLAVTGATGAMAHLSTGLRVVREREWLRFSYPRGRVRQRGNLIADD